VRSPGGTFGIPVKGRDEDWLIVWEPEAGEEELEPGAEDEIKPWRMLW